MSSSYYKKCNVCGRQIQMRKMPHGQWVAFEGYETVHEHSKPPKKGEIREWKVIPPKEKKNISNIEFSNFEINQTRPKSTIIKNIPPKLKSTSSSTFTQNHPQIQSELPNNSFNIQLFISNHPFISGFIILVFLFMCYSFFCANSVFWNLSRATETNIPTKNIQKVITRSSTSTPTVILKKLSPTKELTPTSTAVNLPIMACVENVSSINLRDCPGIEFNVIGFLLKGDCVELIGIDESFLWARTITGGWINTHFVTIKGDVRTLQFTKCELR